MDFPTRIPFSAHLGFELLKFEAGEAEIAVDLSPELCNHYQVAHGGLTMTLLDVAMAHAARAPVSGADAPGVVTVEMKTSFLRPGVGRLIGRGKLLHRSRSLAFCEGSVLTTDGSLIAHATGTFKYMRERPAPSASTQGDTP